MSESYEVNVQLQGNNKRYGHVLNKGEHVLLVVRPQFMIPNMLLFMILGLLFLLPIFVGQSNPELSGTMLILVIAIVTIALINRWVSMQRHWILTNQRLLSREGVLKRKSCVIELKCITGTNTKGGFSSLITASGKVFVYAAGHPGAALVIDSQRNPQTTASFLRAAMIGPKEANFLNVPVKETVKASPETSLA